MADDSTEPPQPPDSGTPAAPSPSPSPAPPPPIEAGSSPLPPQVPGQPQFSVPPQVPGQPQFSGPPQLPGQPQPVAPGPRRGLGLGAIFGIVGGAIALLVVIVIVVAVVIVPRVVGGSVPNAGPSEVLTAYLKAVAASDAKTALSYIEDANKPHDTTLLTDSALRASNKLGAIKSIKVTNPTKSSGFVDLVARYTIGGAPVTAKFTLNDLNGKWKVETGPAGLDLSSRLQGLDLTLNGTKISDGKAIVFPGTYVLATTSKDFAIGSTSKIVVPDGFAPTSAEGPTLSLSDEGLTALRQAVATAVAPCIASKSLTAGCGLDLPATLSDGTQFEDGTIIRTLSGDAQSTLAGLKPSDNLTDIRKISSEPIGGIDAKGTCTKNGTHGTCSVFFGPSLGAATVDFTTDPPTVRW
ncbi:hypothetical protein [Glaciihabitans sp. UYNi722]|uniref:hypothetical protein n=1 Tax=Glaciihabitans sp. UYNi722 TaxID=3156344 RepID=UPI003393B0FD